MVYRTEQNLTGIAFTLPSPPVDEGVNEQGGGDIPRPIAGMPSGLDGGEYAGVNIDEYVDFASLWALWGPLLAGLAPAESSRVLK